jgi:hypothetical protein
MWIYAANTEGNRRDTWGESNPVLGRTPRSSGWWAGEPQLGRVVYGMAHRVDRVKALGNGQVPAVARLAWNRLSCAGTVSTSDFIAYPPDPFVIPTNT